MKKKSDIPAREEGARDFLAALGVTRGGDSNFNVIIMPPAHVTHPTPHPERKFDGTARKWCNGCPYDDGCVVCTIGNDPVSDSERLYMSAVNKRPPEDWWRKEW